MNKIGVATDTYLFVVALVAFSPRPLLTGQVVVRVIREGPQLVDTACEFKTSAPSLDPCPAPSSQVANHFAARSRQQSGQVVSPFAIDFARSLAPTPSLADFVPLSI